MVQTENPKFDPSIEAAETINLWDDCRGWDNDGGTVTGRVSHVQSRISSAAAKMTTQKATVLLHSLSSLLLHEENSPVDVARDPIQCCHEFQCSC